MNISLNFTIFVAKSKKQMLMKKLLMVAVAAMISLSASAQHATGSFALKPTVGLTLANFTGCEVDTKMKAGFAVGLEGEYQATPFLGISGGFLYAMQGAKVKFNIAGLKLGTVSAKVDYLDIPLLANVYVAEGLALKAGVQLGVNVGSDLSLKTSFLSIPIRRIRIFAYRRLHCSRLLKTLSVTVWQHTIRAERYRSMLTERTERSLLTGGVSGRSR